MRDRNDNRNERLYGRQPVAEVLAASRRQVLRIFVADSVRPADEMQRLLATAGRNGTAVIELPTAEIARLAGGAHHQGVVAEVSAYPYADLREILETAEPPPEPPFYLILDHIQDPQNLGALLRSAECSGVTAVIVPADRAAGVTPAVCRASAGAAEHMRVCRVPNVAQTLRRLKQAEVWIAGLDSTEEARDVWEADLTGPIGVVIGGEGTGLQRIVRENCDFLVRIPMGGKIGSLNASAAGAIALFEVRRQRAAARGAAGVRPRA